MKDALSIADATREEMEVWQACIEKDFIQQNGQYLNRSSLGNGEERSTHELLRQMERGIAGQTQMLAALTRKVDELQHKIVHIENKVEAVLIAATPIAATAARAAC